MFSGGFMPSVTLYFQIHQPYRLRSYTVFDLGVDHLYEDAAANKSILVKVANNAYLPMNALLLELIRAHKGKFKVNFAISGTALDQFEEFFPEVLKSFQSLAKTGCVEFLCEPYAHSLAFLYSRGEFTRQVAMHRDRMRQLFGAEPRVFRNAELIYNNDLALEVEKLDFDAILAEGADPVLGWRSPNFVYQPVNCRGLRLLLRNYHLSDDIAFRFSNRDWPEFPLTAEKFARWTHAAGETGEVINLFMDYETFGEHHSRDTGIFEFMRALPGAILQRPDFRFRTLSEVAATCKPVSGIDVPQYISWADAERDLTAWIGNDMQADAIEALYKLEPGVMTCGSGDLLKVWRRLQTSDHFYYMSTKWLSDGDVHSYFNPYGSPYDAYINFMNVLADFEITLNSALGAAPGKKASARGRMRAGAPEKPEKAPRRKTSPAAGEKGASKTGKTRARAVPAA
jgi:alpha-amylase